MFPGLTFQQPVSKKALSLQILLCREFFHQISPPSDHSNRSGKNKERERRAHEMSEEIDGTKNNSDNEWTKNVEMKRQRERGDEKMCNKIA